MMSSLIFSVLVLLFSSVTCQCCKDIAISSSSVAKSFQEHQLGLYSIRNRDGFRGKLVNISQIYSNAKTQMHQQPYPYNVCHTRWPIL